jgi:NAD(P)-dependent dehydrogenase (short-subunit alcohol dehydrogenase family)
MSEQRTIIITGASSGIGKAAAIEIGKAAAIEFARQGNIIIITGRDPESMGRTPRT